LPFPTKPPYTAHLGNLTYEVTSADVEEFFKDCQVTNVRIVEDKLDRKPKGFGYVEFATPEGLQKALGYTDTNFQGRSVKISIAEPRMHPSQFIDSPDSVLTTVTAKDRPEPSRDFSDWSRKGPLPELPQNQRQPSNRGFNRGASFNDNMSDAGSERGGGRRGFFEGDGKVRDFSNWERKGPLSPVPGNGPPMRDGGRVREGGPPMERRRSPAWGEGRSDAGSRPPRREFEARPAAPERVPTAAEQDSQWRLRMQPDASPAATPEVSSPSSPQPQAPKERPRLNLAKRTVSTAENDSAATSASDSKASPFGAARPVDTAAKEREAAEKREQQLKERRDAEEKAKAEKAQKEQDARVARAERADKGQAQEDDRVTSPTATEGGKGRRTSRPSNGTKSSPKENGETSNQSKPNFSILRRDTDGGEEGGDAVEEGDEEDANGNIVHDKDTKPQEPIVEKAAGTQAAEPTARELEEEGWSTVSSSKPKSNKRGGTRALAS
jgi:translation initiation factor 4B